MIESVPQVAASDPTLAKAGQDPSKTANDPKAVGQSATRLTVEQDGTGVYVYRLFDSASGRLLAEVPREKADELKTSPDYAAGDILKTSA